MARRSRKAREIRLVGHHSAGLLISITQLGPFFRQGDIFGRVFCKGCLINCLLFITTLSAIPQRKGKTPTEYLDLFNKGKAWVDTHLFNGEYYQQIVDLNDKELVAQFDQGGLSMHGDSDISAYWNDEHQEIKCQIGDESEIDHVLAQWHSTFIIWVSFSIRSK